VGSAGQVNRNNTTVYYVAARSMPGAIAVGSYPGSGLARTVQLGFAPSFVLIHSDATFAVARMASVPGAQDLTLPVASSPPFGNGILAFTAQAFDLGTDATVNASPTTYHWISFGTSLTLDGGMPEPDAGTDAGDDAGAADAGPASADGGAGATDAGSAGGDGGPETPQTLGVACGCQAGPPGAVLALLGLTCLAAAGRARRRTADSTG
jgi:hypothetical protein